MSKRLGGVVQGNWRHFLGGREHYHRLQKIRVLARQQRVLKELAEAPAYGHYAAVGRAEVERSLAARFNVNVRTIRRDLKAILQASPTCPLCGQDVPAKAPKP